MEEEKSLFELQTDHYAAEEIIDTARWTKLLGVLMAIAIGLIVLLFLAGWNKISYLFAAEVGDSSTQTAMAFILVFLVVIAGVIGTMVFFLIRGAGRLKEGMQRKEQQVFNSGLGDIKSFFIIYGVLSLLGLVINLFSYLK